MIIDMEHHFSTETQLRRRGHTSVEVKRGYDETGKFRSSLPLASMSIEHHLKFMDAAGIRS